MEALTYNQWLGAELGRKNKITVILLGFGFMWDSESHQAFVKQRCSFKEQYISLKLQKRAAIYSKLGLFFV